MSGIIWTKFYWSDWESDPGLKLCSLAAQGLWMRMLCVAAGHDPVGYVAVNGIALDNAGIAQATGQPLETVNLLLPELEKFGVFSRARHGMIYARRMVKDAKKAQTARENGQNGGNPNLCKDEGKKTSVKQKETGRSDPMDSSTYQSPESRKKVMSSNEDSSVFEAEAGADDFGVLPKPEEEIHDDFGGPPEPAKPKAIVPIVMPTTKVPKSDKGTRLPEGWRPNADETNYALNLGLAVERVDRIAMDFSEYWLSKPGAAARKTNWSLTWQGWIRREIDRNGTGTRNGAGAAIAPGSRNDRVGKMLRGAAQAAYRRGPQSG